PRYARNSHSFPTRRSSDLQCFAGAEFRYAGFGEELRTHAARGDDFSPFPMREYEIGLSLFPGEITRVTGHLGRHFHLGFGRSFRSEEHTSELQSRENLVCR